MTKNIGEAFRDQRTAINWTKIAYLQAKYKRSSWKQQYNVKNGIEVINKRYNSYILSKTWPHEEETGEILLFVWVSIVTPLLLLWASPRYKFLNFKVKLLIFGILLSIFLCDRHKKFFKSVSLWEPWQGLHYRVL